MRVRLISVGSRMPGWVDEAYSGYCKRLGTDLPVQLVEIETARRGRSVSIDKLREQEGEALLKAAEGARIVALDVDGRGLSTQAMADQLARWQHDGRDLALLIGGPDGLSEKVRQRAETRWSLSALTLPHPLVRIVVIEQLYRCWSLWHGHPYHR